MFDAKRHQFCQWKLTLGNNENQLTFFNWEILYKANDCMIYIRICHTYSFEKLMFLIRIEPPKCSPSLYVHWLCSSFIYPSPSDRVNHSRDELSSMRCIYDVLPLQLPVICWHARRVAPSTHVLQLDGGLGRSVLLKPFLSATWYDYTPTWKNIVCIWFSHLS